MIENEFKVMLTDEQYEKIIAMYDWNKVLVQINHYYDSDNFDLEKQNITCRVREIDGKYSWQMKFPTYKVLSRLEFEEPLDSLPEEIDADKATRPNPHRHDMLPVVKRLGSLKTTRNVYCFKGGEIDLDKSEYFGKVDYELEIEFTDEDAARAVLDEITEKLGLTPNTEERVGKIRRFLDEYSKSANNG